MTRTPPRKTKLYRKKMWCVAWPNDWSHGGIEVYQTRYRARKDARSFFDGALCSPGLGNGRVFRVLISELPKAAGRGRKS